MKVSAIVPTYNRAALLPRALASIANQTHSDIEVLVVDDGSTDATAQVVAQIAATFPHPVHYFRKSNGGCASARNAGLRRATGDCVAFLDSDDQWLPDALAQLAAELQRSGADFVYSPAIEMRADGSETLNRPVAAGEPARLAALHFEVSNLRNGSALLHCRVIDAVGDFDETLGHNEDSDFMQRVAIQCKGAYVDRPSVRVFHHVGRKSANRLAVQRAVLTSAEKILRSQPAFAHSLGGRAERRLRRIRAELLAELIAAGEFDEARAFEAAHRVADDFATRLALRTGSPLPLAFARRIRGGWGRLQRLAGRAAR